MRFLFAPAATAAAAIACAALLWLVPAAHSYPPDAPVSFATVEQIHYLSNFFLYFGSVSLCVLSGLFFFSPPLLSRERIRCAVSFPGSQKILLAIATLLVAIVAFTSQFFYSISGSLVRIREPFTALLTDTFHEGELLAPILSLKTAAVPKPLLAHGPGMDLLPGLFASRFFSGDQTMSGTRIGAAVLTLAAFACFVFATYQIVCFVRPGRTVADFSLRLGALVTTLALYTHLARGSPRRLIFFLQIGIVFRLLRAPRFVVLPFLLGATLPLGFVYNYAIGMAGILFVVAGSLLFCVREPSVHRAKFVAALLAGCMVASVGSWMLLGPEWISAIASNISYWGRFGQILTFTPMFRRDWLARPEWYVDALLTIVPPALLCEFVLAEYLKSRNVASTLRRRAAEILLLTACLAESRTFLERADFQHFGFAAPMFVLAAAVLGMMLVAPAAVGFTRGLTRPKRIYIPVLLLAVAALAEFPNLRPDAIVFKATDFAAALHTTDAQLLRADYAEAVRAVKPLLSRQVCFYTLTSEGAWYQLLDSPSCSAFAQLNYARSSEGQARVLEDLRRFRPRIILVNGDLRDGGYDGISLQQHSAPVWNYIAESYRPLLTAGGFHFYELRD